jgi:hypothetical protein
MVMGVVTWSIYVLVVKQKFHPTSKCSTVVQSPDTNFYDKSNK